MKRNDAIYYAKQLVKTILDLRDNDEDFSCMLAHPESINGKKPAEMVIDAFAEWVFPDDDEEETT